MFAQQVNQIVINKNKNIITEQSLSKSKEALSSSSQGSHKTKTRLLVALTAPSPKLKPEIDRLIEECTNNSEGWPALHWAIAKLHRPDIALHILQLYPEEINAITPAIRESVTLYRDNGWAGEQPEEVGLTTEGASALWLAVKEGYTDLVRALIERGADSNVMRRFRIVDKPTHTYRLEAPPSEYGTTALSEAMQLQKKEIVQLLLEGGASTDSVFYHTDYGHHQGWIHTTSHYGVAGYLVKLGSEKDLWRIFMAAQTHQPISEITEEDLEFVRARFQESKSPIQAACSKGDLESAQKLIDLGFNPYANYGNPEICETLHKRGWTFESVEFLLRNNIDRSKFLLICAQDNLIQFLPRVLDFGVTCEEALRVAIERGQSSFITLLLDAHHPVSPPIIYQAIQSRNIPLLKRLIPLMNKEELQAHFDRTDSPIVNLLSDNSEALEFLFSQEFLFHRESLLRQACQKGSLSTLKLLVQKYGFPYDMQKELITIAAIGHWDDLFNYLWDSK